MGQTLGVTDVLGPGSSPSAAELAAAMVAMKDGVVLLGPDLHIRWGNPALCRMLGYDLPDIVGENIVPFLHPDEVQFAFHAVTIASAEPDRQVPGTYRLRHRDGSWLSAELSASFAPATHIGDGDGSLTVITVRPTAHRDVLTNGYLDLTRGEPIRAVVEDALTWYRERAQRYRIGLSFLDPNGDEWHHIGDQLPAELRGLPPHLDDPRSPWAKVLGGTDHVVADLPDLPDEIAEAARRAGVRATMVLSVPDPVGTPALLTFWIDADPTLFPQGYTVKTPALVLIELALERRFHQAQLELAASTDPLTHLANRRAFFDRLASLGTGGPAPSGPAPASGVPVTVLYLDLDGFKAVNDAHGHAAGDALLVAVADRLRTCLRPGDVLARLGGDEFAAVCPGVATEAEATAVADRLLAAVHRPADLGAVTLTPGISIGIAVDPSGAVGEQALLAAADAAMYDAKRAGKGRWMLAAT